METPNKLVLSVTESVVRTAWRLSIILTATEVALWFVTPGGALTLFLAAIAYFMLSNYTAYRIGAHNYRVGPATAAYSCAVASLLALVAAVSTLCG